MRRFIGGYWSQLSIPVRISLALFAIFVACWVASYGRVRAWDTEDERNTVMVYEGQMVWKHRSAAGSDYAEASGPSSGFAFLGIGAFKTPTANNEHLWTLLVPFWALTLLAAIVPSVRLWQFRRTELRKRRIDCGLCPTCGYDVRATPERCPECGTATLTQVAQDKVAGGPGRCG